MTSYSRTASIAAALLLAGCAIAPLHAEERIARYHVQIDVQSNAALEVTETIVVDAEGQSIRRGIYRDFPTRYRDSNGHRVVVDFDMIEVLRNGEPEPWFTERISNGIRINTGNDQMLQVPATIEYTLRYRTTRQLGFFEQHDELYWNVTGNDWAFSIEQASATVNLPMPVAVDQLRARAYTGAFGSREQHAHASVASPGQSRFHTTRALGPGQGLTIVTEWPKGIITEPSRHQQIGWLIKDNRSVLVMLIGIPLIVWFYYTQWHRKGRDPKPGVIIARYDPPQGYSPAGLRFMLRRAYDARCFAADLVDLGVKGLIRIRREAGRSGWFKQAPDWIIERANPATVIPIPPSQTALMHHLFTQGDEVRLEQANAKLLMRTRTEQAKALAQRFKAAYLVGNWGIVGVGVALSIGLVALALLIGQGSAPGITLTLAGVLALINLVFIWLVQTVTAKGRRLLDHIEGLKRYLAVAERQDLAQLEHRNPDEPELSVQRFEALLPYALALDVEKAWTEQFERAAGVAIASAAVGEMAWYTNSSGRTESLAELGNSLGKHFTSQISSSSSPPGSSSGGGGFSGGGGGGGGGGGR
ncbi:MAG: DUF2207 domain-containing protein [Pseudomonadota bacterium]